MAKRPEALSKIFQLTANRDELDRKVYVDFLRNVGLAKRIPKGISINMCWYEESSHPSKVRNSTLCAIFFFYAKVQSVQQKLKSNLFTSESGQYARDALSFYEFLLFCRDFRLVPRLITKDEVLFLWRVLITEKIRSNTIGAQDATFLLNLDGFKDLLSRIAILTYNKPGIRKMLISSNGVMPTIHEQIHALAIYLHLDDARWIKNRINTVSTNTVSKINARSAGDDKNPQTRIELREDLHAKRLSKLLSKGDDATVVSTDTPTADRVTRNLDMSQVEQVASSVRFNVNGLVYQPEEETEKDDDRGTEDRAHRSALDEVVATLLGTAARALPPATSGRRMSGSQSGSKAEENPRGEGSGSQTSLRDYKKAAQLGHTRRIHICHSQEIALSEYKPAWSSILNDYADLHAYKRHKKHSDDLTDGKQMTNNFLDMGSVTEGSHCVIKLAVTNRTSHDTSINVWTEGFSEFGEVRVTCHPDSMAPGLTKTVYVSFVAHDLGGGRRNTSGVIHVQASHKLTNRTSNTISHHTLPSEFIVSCPVMLRVVKSAIGDRPGRGVSSQFPLCTDNSVDRLSLQFVPDYVEQQEKQMLYTSATNSFVLPSVPDFSSSAIVMDHARVSTAESRQGFSVSAKSGSRSGGNRKFMSTSTSRDPGMTMTTTQTVSYDDNVEHIGTGYEARDEIPSYPHPPRSSSAHTRTLSSRSGNRLKTR